ncbi:hypothetical protein AHAS_Ahas11G0161600 [Arachis hypogaea]
MASYRLILFKEDPSKDAAAGEDHMVVDIVSSSLEEDEVRDGELGQQPNTHV